MDIRIMVIQKLQSSIRLYFAQSIIAQYRTKKWILVAHSFGCAIAAVLAVQNKTLVKNYFTAGQQPT